MLGIFMGCGNDSDPVVITPVEPALPTGGTFGVYTDVGGTDCNLQDPGTGVVTYYIVHMGTEGATAAEFQVEFNGFTGTMLSASSPFQTVIGDPMTGMSLAYGACLPGPALVATVRFTSTSASPACASVTVVPHPISGQIGVVDCDGRLLVGNGKTSYFNNDGSCPCSIPSTPGTDQGKIKNIYSD
jgi:hypothetical protein